MKILKCACFLSCLVLLTGSGSAQTPAFRLPAARNSAPEAKALLKYLYDISGKQILSGQMGEKWNVNRTFEYVKGQSGQYPAVYGADFLFGDERRQNLVTAAKYWHSQGCIILLGWHAVQPDKPEDSQTGWDDMHAGRWPEDKMNKILTPGDPYHTEWMKRVDRIAGYLKQLNDAGIPVIWRPFHESNGGWFWWGRQEKLYHKLWAQMFDRMHTYNKLTNLLWFYSPNFPNPAYAGTLESDYPGHAYTDILGIDIYENYGHSYRLTDYQELLRIGENRPVAIGENGKIPNVAQLKKDMPRYVLWNTWNGFESQHGNTTAWYKTVYGDPYTLGQGEVKITPWNAAWDQVTATAEPGKQTTLAVNRSGPPMTIRIGESIRTPGSNSWRTLLGRSTSRSNRVMPLVVSPSVEYLSR